MPEIQTVTLTVDIGPSSNSGQTDPSSTGTGIEGSQDDATLDTPDSGSLREFAPKKVDVERTATSDAGMVEIEGIFLDEEPEPNDIVEVSINNELVFRGRTISAVRNHKGIYTIKAFDHQYDLHKIRLDHDIEGDEYNVQLARRKLREHDIPHQIAAPGRFDGENGPTEWEMTRRPLSKMLDEVAERLDGIWYVDRANVVRIVPNPPDVTHDLEHFIEITAGKSEASTNEVVVFGQPKQDQAVDLTKERITSRTEIDVSGENGENAPYEKQETHDNQNLSSQAEIDSVLDSKVGQYMRDMKLGEVKLVGDTRLDPFETVTIPNIEGNDPLLVGDYGVQRVNHVLSPSDGFVTNVDLTFADSRIKFAIQKGEPGAGPTDDDTGTGGGGGIE